MEQLIITVAAISFLILPLPLALIISTAAMSYFIVQCRKKYRQNPPKENSVVIGALGIIFAIAGLGIIAQGNQYFYLACVAFYLMLVAFIAFFIRSQYKDNVTIAEQTDKEEKISLEKDNQSLQDTLNGFRKEMHAALEREMEFVSEKITNDIQKNMDRLLGTYSTYKSPEEIAEIIEKEREKSDDEFHKQENTLRDEYEKQFTLKEREYKDDFNRQLLVIKQEIKKNSQVSAQAEADYIERENQLREDFEKKITMAKKQFKEESDRQKQFQERKYNLFKRKRDAQLDVLYRQLQESNAQKMDLEKRKKESEEELASIHQLLNEQNEVIDQLEAANDTSPNNVIQNKEIRQAFLRALDEAQQEIDIISPWMNRRVVDSNLVNKFQGLLQKGIKLKILYGIVNHSNEKENVINGDIAPTTKRTAKMLKQCLGKYPNFAMKQTDTHAKLFLCDDKFYVISSFNILSYDGEGSRGELGEISYNQQLVRAYRKRFFNF